MPWGLGESQPSAFLLEGVRLALGLGLRLPPTVFMGLFLGRLLLGRGLLLRRALGLLLRRLDHLGLGLGHGNALGVDRLRLLGRNDHLLLDPPSPLGDRGPLADLLAQVVELRPAHIAASGHLQLLDLRRVERKGPFDPDAEGLLADGEGLAEPLPWRLGTMPSKTWVRLRLPSTT